MSKPKLTFLDLLFDLYHLKFYKSSTSKLRPGLPWLPKRISKSQFDISLGFSKLCQFKVRLIYSHFGTTYSSKEWMTKIIPFHFQRFPNTLKMLLECQFPQSWANYPSYWSWHSLTHLWGREDAPRNPIPIRAHWVH